MDRVIVYGIGDAGKRILSALSYSLRLGLYPAVVIDDDPVLDGESMPEMGYRRRRSVPVQRGPITSALLNSCRCSTLIVALPNLSSEQIAAAVDAASEAGSRVLFLSATELQEQKWTEPIDIDGLSLTPMLESFERWPYSIAKRVVDLIGSSLLLVLVRSSALPDCTLYKDGFARPRAFRSEQSGPQWKALQDVQIPFDVQRHTAI